MKIDIAPYDPHWPEMFERYKERITAALGGNAISIEHIGSTSVPALAAKPVIDIQVGLADTDKLNAAILLMQQAGFTYMHKYEHLMPARRYFVLYEHQDGLVPPAILSGQEVVPSGFVNVAHIHCWVQGTIDCVRHIAFRDYLRTHEHVRSAYQSLKQDLAQKEWESSLAYSEAKNDFIKSVEADALVWYSTTL